MSGSVENFWAMANNNEYLNLTHRIAEDLGRKHDTLEDLIEFLHSVEAEKLNPYNIFSLPRGTIEILTAPVIERTILSSCNGSFIYSDHEG